MYGNSKSRERTGALQAGAVKIELTPSASYGAAAECSLSVPRQTV